MTEIDRYGIGVVVEKALDQVNPYRCVPLSLSLRVCARAPLSPSRRIYTDDPNVLLWCFPLPARSNRCALSLLASLSFFLLLLASAATVVLCC